MLYLLQVNEWAKVGYTTDRDTLERRMGAYRTHCPGVQLIGIREGTKEDEHRYHTSFEQYEDWGEWRKVPKDILDTIKGDFTPVGIQMKPGTGKLSESEKATKKKYREANREDILQKKKEYRDTHKEVIKASQKAWRDARKKEKAAYDKQYYEVHKEGRKASHKAYYEEHQDELRAKAREYWKKKHSKNI